MAKKDPQSGKAPEKSPNPPNPKPTPDADRVAELTAQLEEQTAAAETLRGQLSECEATVAALQRQLVETAAERDSLHEALAGIQRDFATENVCEVMVRRGFDRAKTTYPKGAVIARVQLPEGWNLNELVDRIRHDFLTDKPAERR